MGSTLALSPPLRDELVERRELRGAAKVGVARLRLCPSRKKEFLSRTSGRSASLQEPPKGKRSDRHLPRPLEQELKTYEKHREDLIGRAEGKFVLIHGEEVVGVFDSKQDAIRQGYTGLGNVPFLVRQVVKVETPQTYVSNLLA